jgi:serine/threonine-protein kinase RsbW
MSEPDRAHLKSPADGETMARLRGFVEDFAGAQRIGIDDRARVLIVVEELVTNLVKYGYPAGMQPGSVEITLRRVGDRLDIEIVDDGQPFDPFARPEPLLDGDLESRPIGGLGLHLVKSLMDRTDYRRDGRRNIVSMSRCIESAAGPGG